MCKSTVVLLSVFVAMELRSVDAEALIRGGCCLPAELALRVAGAIPENATLGDLMMLEQNSTGWRVDFPTLLGEWLSKQEADKDFCLFAGSKEQIDFVRRHAEGEPSRIDAERC
jgi:hypothetical protein